MSAFLNVEHLIVAYGGIIAVNDFSFTVEEGEIVALIGANGAGKTSTLSAISGTVTPRSGKIEFRGNPINRLSPADRVMNGIVLTPEGRHIFPYLSVAENLSAGAFLDSDKNRVETNRERALSLFPVLRERLKQPGRTLSGGEQQMLAIARALMSEPKILLLDEPSLGLAPKVSQTIFSTIAQMRETGVSILLVEQNAHAALKLANRAYVLETGCLAHEGLASELLKNDAIKAAYLGA